MKVVIAGTRTFGNQELLKRAIISAGFPITEVVSGKASGVDSLGEEWAELNNIIVKPFPPDYKKYQAKIAPIMRNHQMADYADCLLAIWDGKSRGTKDIIDYTKKIGKEIYIAYVNNDEIFKEERFPASSKKKISIIASSEITDYEKIKIGIQNLVQYSKLDIGELVTKKEQTVDYLIQRWATENDIVIKYFFSKKDTGDSKTERNFEIGKYAHCIFAIWNGEPKGGIHATFEFCKNHKMNLIVLNIKTNEIIDRRFNV